MKEAISKLGKHSVIYGLGSAASKLIAFFLLPLYTVYLTPADYGVLQICNTLGALLLVFYQMGMTSSMFKVYFNEESESLRKKIFSTTFWFYLCIGGLATIIIYLFRFPLAKILISVENGAYLLTIVVVAVYFEGTINLGLAILRAKENSKYYSIISLIRVVFFAFLNVLFVSVYRRGFIGVREGTLLSLIVVLVALYPIFKKNIELSFSKDFLKEILGLGIPLAIGGMGMWVLNLTDRYMLKFLLPQEIALTQVGLYSFGAKFATLLKFLIVMPFSLSWGALMFSYQKHPDAKRLYSRVLNIFVFIGGILVLALSIFGKDIISIVSQSSDYYDSYRVIPILAFSSILAGTNLILSVVVTLPGKTKYISIANITAALINVVLNYYLIPKYGMIGAALTSLTSFVIMNGILYYFAQKNYFIPYALFKVLLYLLSISVITIACVYFEVHFALKLLFLLLFIGLAPSFGLVNYSEITQFTKIMLLKVKI